MTGGDGSVEECRAQDVQMLAIDALPTEPVQTDDTELLDSELTEDERTAIAAKLKEADALNDEVARAQIRGQAPGIETVEGTHDAAAPDAPAPQNGTSATDAVMGSLFGGVWGWMSGKDLLEQH